jgi:hypothetical protein
VTVELQGAGLLHSRLVGGILQLLYDLLPNLVDGGLGCGGGVLAAGASCQLCGLVRGVKRAGK